MLKYVFLPAEISDIVLIPPLRCAAILSCTRPGHLGRRAYAL